MAENCIGKPCDDGNEVASVDQEVLAEIGNLRDRTCRDEPIMRLRTTKVLLVFAVALFHTLVVLNNTTDYALNYQFVRHVLMMDSTLPGNHGMWRAVYSPLLQLLFYVAIIVWEFLTMVLLWWGEARLMKAYRGTAHEFEGAKSVAVAALSLSLLMWLLAFLDVGGEWFLMWQSRTWNGQEAAFRMFTVVGIVLLLVSQPETEHNLPLPGTLGSPAHCAQSAGDPQQSRTQVHDVDVGSFP